MAGTEDIRIIEVAWSDVTRIELDPTQVHNARVEAVEYM